MVHRAGARVEVVFRPECPTFGTKWQHVDGVAERFTDAGEGAQRCGQYRFKVGLNRAGQHGGGPFGANRDGDWIAIDDCGGDELAVRKIVDDVYKRALGRGDGGGAGVLNGVLVCAVEKHGTNCIAVVHRAICEGQFALCSPAVDFRGGVLCQHAYAAFGFHQKPQLCHCRIATARYDNPASRDG